MIPDIDISESSTLLRQGFQQLGREATAQVGTNVAALAAGMANPAAGVLLSVACVGLAQDKAVELGAEVDRRLSAYLEEVEPSKSKHQAGLVFALRGIVRCLPDSDQWENSLIQTANGDPGTLLDLLEAYQHDDSRRERLETAVTDILEGDIGDELDGEEYTDFIDYLEDAFEVETRDDALALFFDIRDLLHSREIHETLETTYGIETNVTEIERELEATRTSLENRLDSILEANLRDEAFVRLSPYYFEQRQTKPPETCWRAGFGLSEIRAGYHLERERASDTERTRVSGKLCNQLRDGTDTVVLGRPGAGKSTICRSVACEWYERRIGTVFYRESGSGQHFTRPGVLEERIHDAEGHVLVVVEDVTRENAKRAFRVLQEFESDQRVTFLLDSRIQEWRDANNQITESRILTLKNNLSTYRVPTFDERECERAIQRFESLTGRTVAESPTDLLSSIETDIGVGEMYLLGYRLSSYAIDPLDDDPAQKTTGLQSEIKEVYNHLHQSDGDLSLQVGITVNLLNAAEIGTYPELIHALAEEYPRHEDQPQVAHREISEVVEQFTGRILFEGDERYRSNHPFWSEQFLKEALERDDQYVNQLFDNCVNALFRLVDESDRRDCIERWFRGDVTYLNEIDDRPQLTANSLVENVFELGQRNPGLAPLYGPTEYSHIVLPDVCPPELRLRCRKWRGMMYRDHGEYEIAKTELKRLIELAREKADLDEESRKRLVGEGFVQLSRVYRETGKPDVARDRLQTSIDLFEEIDELESKARAYTGLGIIARRKGDLDDAIEYHDRSLEIYQKANYQFGVSRALNNRGMVEKERGDLEKAMESVEESIELKRTTGDRRISLAKSYNTLGEILFQKGKLEEAQRRFERSLQMKRDTDYRSGMAWSRYYLGLVELERGNLSTARQHVEESLQIRRELEEQLAIGRCRNVLGAIERREGNYDRAEENHERAIDKFQKVGDKQGVARYHRYMGDLERKRGHLEDAEEHYRRALSAFEESGYMRGIGKTRRGLGQLALGRDDYFTARRYFSDASETFRRMGAYGQAILVIEDQIEVFGELDEADAAADRRARIEELGEYVSGYEQRCSALSAEPESSTESS